jgi:hypothetical protein
MKLVYVSQKMDNLSRLLVLLTILDFILVLLTLLRRIN